MGSLLSHAFIPPDDLMGCSSLPGKPGEEDIVTCLPPSLEAEWLWGMVQALSLLLVYGFVLFNASNMLSTGSEAREPRPARRCKSHQTCARVCRVRLCSSCSSSPPWRAWWGASSFPS